MFQGCQLSGAARIGQLYCTCDGRKLYSPYPRKGLDQRRANLSDARLITLPRCQSVERIERKHLTRSSEAQRIECFGVEVNTRSRTACQAGQIFLLSNFDKLLAWSKALDRLAFHLDPP